MTITRWLDERLYPGFEDDWDHKRFRALVESRLEPHFAVLDYGAGRGAVEELNFRGRARLVAGVDPDVVVTQNPYLDEARVLTLPEAAIPYPDESFDLVLSNNVLEHLPSPRATFEEIHRVLKPGGLFLAKTPNRFHYVPLFASLTPHGFHVFYNRLRGREERDTFPTHYRCNSRRAAARQARAAGLEVIDVSTWEGRPEYLRIAAPLYLLGFLYERLVNRSRLFAGLRCVLVLTARKPPAGSTGAA